MSVYSTNISHRSFYGQISAVCFFLGVILATAKYTANQVSHSGNAISRPGFSYDVANIKQATIKDAEYETVLKQKNEYITKLETKLSKGNGATSLLSKTLQETKFSAGLTDALGPGIQISLTDSQRQQFVGVEGLKQSILIHDSDINSVINELKACGAEAIAVNGQRIVASTSVRCVGPVVHVNGVPAAPPYIIQAIGDQEALFNGMDLPGGVFAELRHFDPDMIHMEKRANLRIPAFGGSPRMRFAHPPPQPGGDSDSDTSHSEGQ